MNPSFLRIRRPLDDAIRRYGTWIGVPEIEPLREIAERDAIDAALEDDEWKGLAVYIFASGPWAVFQELSGGLGERSADEWIRLADGGDLVFAGYNDAIGYGEWLQIDGGRLVRHFLQDEQEPDADVNVGRLPDEDREPLADWPDVASRVDGDDESFTGRERGWLWIHQAA